MIRFLDNMIDTIEWFLTGLADCCVNECCGCCYKEDRTYHSNSEYMED